MKKIVLMIISALIFVGIAGCNKKISEDEEISKDEFCSYINVENMDKTIHVINDYLANLSNKLND